MPQPLPANPRPTVTPAATETDAQRPPVPNRLMSLDALRGFDMFWIVGGDYVVRTLPTVHDSAVTRALADEMDHVKWAGFHFYDLIFPLFLFIVGVAVVFSVPRMIEQRGKAAAIQRIVIRSVVLFLLGVFYMGGVANGFENVYLAGVLHRIAVAYFFAALVFCFCRTRAMGAICLGLLVGYWALMTFVPVPGFGEASYEQGKNLAHYIDQRFLPGRKFEGTLLSTLAAVANCLLGVCAGLLLQNKNVRDQQKVLWLLGGGAASLALGFAWARQFPIIKLLWTSSYVLVACGYSALLLAVFYQVIELWRLRLWARPLVWLGMNAITIYLVANIVNFRKLAERLVGGDIQKYFNAQVAAGTGDLLVGLVALLFVLWLVCFLYQRRIFLRL